MFHHEFPRNALTTPGSGRFRAGRHRATLTAMDAIAPWLTPALLVALFAWLRLDIREMRRDLNDRIDKTGKRIDDFAKDVSFLAGRRDRDAA